MHILFYLHFGCQTYIYIYKGPPGGLAFGILVTLDYIVGSAFTACN